MLYLLANRRGVVRRLAGGVALVTAFATAGNASFAATQDAQAPITLGTCNAEVSEALAPIVRDPASVGYQFMNLRDVPARAVVTKITYGDASWYFEDRGTFASGTAIDRNRLGALAVQGVAPMACEITHVEYADGMTWDAQPAIASATP